jgi:hypothetical protein
MKIQLALRDTFDGFQTFQLLEYPDPAHLAVCLAAWIAGYGGIKYGTVATVQPHLDDAYNMADWEKFQDAARQLDLAGVVV